MNRLVIIGNGFDLAHDLKTSYADFINWYWEQRVNGFLDEMTSVSADPLCTFKMNDSFKCWKTFALQLSRVNKKSGKDVVKDIRSNPAKYGVKFSLLFGDIIKNVESKGWVDIENDYYQLLKRYTESTDCSHSVKELNEQLAYLKERLVEYLRTIGTNQYKKELHNPMIEFFDPADFSTEGKKKALENMRLENTNLEEIQNNFEEQKKLRPERIMLLSFNYTATAKMYGNFNVEFNYIHGDLEHPKNIIFGYGDDLDKNYKDILDRNDKELLKNNKSTKYLETRHYHDMLEFLMAAPFQVLIMGHSCGNSDRTLLNTVFEHENCVSIKPFYHKWDDGSDNYLELVQNISRNFTNMRLFRDRVVNKEQCKTM
jgi:hypothetical protein